MRNHCTIFHSRCTIFYCHQQCTWFLIFLHSCRHLFYFVSGVILNECGVVCPCRFDLLFSNFCSDVEHPFMWFLAICISSLEKYLFQSFFMSLFIADYRSSYISWILFPYQIYDWKCFSSFCGLRFHSVVSFHEQKFLMLMKSNLSTFSFVPFAVDVISKKSLPYPASWRFYSIFSS